MKNIYAKQINKIPFSWTNNVSHSVERDVNTGDIWVVKSPGIIDMPDICKCFDFIIPADYNIPQLPGVCDTTTCSVNMKSVFTTATRFLGVEEAFIKLFRKTLELSDITNEYIRWNERLLATRSDNIDILILGDELATSRGMMFSLSLYTEIILPHHNRFIELSTKYNKPIWYHSDGDASQVVPILKDAGFSGIYYEDIGSMKETLYKHNFPGIEVIRIECL